MITGTPTIHEALRPSVRTHQSTAMSVAGGRICVKTSLTCEEVFSPWNTNMVLNAPHGRRKDEGGCIIAGMISSRIVWKGFSRINVQYFDVFSRISLNLLHDARKEVITKV